MVEETRTIVTTMDQAVREAIVRHRPKSLTVGTVRRVRRLLSTAWTMAMLFLLDNVHANRILHGHPMLRYLYPKRKSRISFWISLPNLAFRETA